MWNASRLLTLGLASLGASDTHLPGAEMSVLRAITKPLRDALESREKLRDLPVFVLQAALNGIGQAVLIGSKIKAAIKQHFAGDEAQDGERTETATAPADERTAAQKPEQASEQASEERRETRRPPVIYAPRPSKAERADAVTAETPAVEPAPAAAASAETAQAETTKTAAATAETTTAAPAEAGTAQTEAAGAAQAETAQTETPQAAAIPAEPAPAETPQAPTTTAETAATSETAETGEEAAPAEAKKPRTRR
ncbi:MAG: hypothetical protein IRZ07_19640, partial [Microbispora sp.]|nr:hypothetical protein [Microbispora sp.]